MNTTIVGYCVLQEQLVNGQWQWTPLDNIIANNKLAIQAYIEGLDDAYPNKHRTGTIIVGD